MALFIRKEQLLACTVGQVGYYNTFLGVTLEDIEEFKKILMSMKPKGMYVYIDNLDGKTYYNERWRKNYYLFRNQFKLEFDVVFYKKQENVIDFEVELLKKALKGTSEEIGIFLNEDIVGNAIKQFKDYYKQKYDINNSNEQSKENNFQKRDYVLSDGRIIKIDSGFDSDFKLDNKKGNGFFVAYPYAYYNNYGGVFQIIFDSNGQIVEPAFDLCHQSGSYIFLEMFDSSGNMIISTKYDKTKTINSCTYIHYKITKNDKGYELVKGKTWNDEELKSFEMLSDDVIQVTKWSDKSETFYNCQTFEEHMNLSDITSLDDDESIRKTLFNNKD